MNKRPLNGLRQSSVMMQQPVTREERISWAVDRLMAACHAYAHNTDAAMEGAFAASVRARQLELERASMPATDDDRARAIAAAKKRISRAGDPRESQKRKPIGGSV